MKTTAFLLYALLLTLAFPSFVAAHLSGFTVPETVNGEGGWKNYVPPIELNKGNVANFHPPTITPEGAVAYFYASLIRGDEDFMFVLPRKEHKPKAASQEVLLKETAKYAKAEFTQAKLLGRKNINNNQYQIRISFETTFPGGSDSVTDVITVEKFDNQWFVTRPPT